MQQLLLAGGLLLSLMAHDARAQQQPSGESTQREESSRAPQTIYVVGAVRSPARLEFNRSVRLTEALCCVGGLLPENNNKIRIYRGGLGTKDSTVIYVNLKAIKKRPAENLILQPYDVVEVVGKSRHGGHVTPITRILELPARKVN